MSVINPLAATMPVAPVTAWHPPREGREHDLRVHQIVRASVAEGGQERVMLELGQRRFWAETGLPLKTGQTLNLRVMSLAPRLELKLVEDPVGERLSRLLHLIGEKWDLAAVLRGVVAEGGAQPPIDAGLRTVLDQFLQLLGTSPEALTGGSLRDLLRKLGPGAAGGDSATFRELLLETHRQLLGAHDARAEDVARLLQQLELSLLCQARLAQSGLTLLALPLPFVETGYLIAEHGRAAREGEAHSTLTLYLSLSGLGDLRIDFLHEAPGLFLRFRCSSPETMAFLSDFHEELKAGLGDLPLRGVAFVTGADNPVQALLRRLLPGGEGVLNTRV
jgi:hypothetical protein